MWDTCDGVRESRTSVQCTHCAVVGGILGIIFNQRLHEALCPRLPTGVAGQTAHRPRLGATLSASANAGIRVLMIVPE